MRYCKNCGKEMSDQAKFCVACGTPATQPANSPQVVFCENCGNKLSEGANFCARCGKQLVPPHSAEYRSSVATKHANGSAVKRYDIIEYLKTAVSLEESLYTQNQAIERMQEHIDSLGIADYYEKPSRPNDSDGFLGGALTIGGMGAFIGAIIGLFVGGLVKGAVIGGVAFFIIAAVIFAKGEAAVDDEFQRRMDAYQAAVAADKARVEAELEEIPRLKEWLAVMISMKEETESVLDRYYAEDVLYKKYHRDMVAVYSFYEYFTSGRCSTFYGHEGAYNTYEHDIQMKLILQKLDQVIENLEEIRAGQYALYCAIKEGNQIAEQLVLEAAKQTQFTAQIAENTAVAAYYSEVSASNARACALIGLANHISIWEVHRRIGE